MDSSAHRNRVLRALLLCALVLLTSAERRLAYLDFNTVPAADLRFENNDKPDGDEIINRLIFVDDAKEPIALAVGEVCQPVVPAASCALSLIVVRLSESRAPPFALSPLV